MTKLEEVARAWWNAESLRAADRPRLTSWEEESEKTKEAYLFCAKAAVEAMQNPSEAMVIAGATAMSGIMVENEPVTASTIIGQPKDVYNAMLQAVLDEHTGEG